MDSLASIELMHNHAIVRYNQPTDGGVSKVVTGMVGYDDLSKIFQVSSTYTSRILPPNVVMLKDNPDRLILVTHRPLGYIPFYYRDEEHMIHVPHMYFKWMLTKTSDPNEYLRSERTSHPLYVWFSWSEPSEDTILYQPKIGNVSGSGICMGMNRLDAKIHLNDLHGYEDSFIVGIHNDDYVNIAGYRKGLNRKYETHEDFANAAFISKDESILLSEIFG